ncbi:uncharacterized protein G2W53_006744 [Senna tora]|uniref:Uncharacterized protein n=1 Tax=Senna tora TaxID=362788 RepID=A0A835CGR8_9FABA|nr:uncharacterized protein G2W53_006744 [Senna tora]
MLNTATGMVTLQGGRFSQQSVEPKDDDEVDRRGWRSDRAEDDGAMLWRCEGYKKRRRSQFAAMGLD